jgi:hypothetical protein
MSPSRPKPAFQFNPDSNTSALLLNVVGSSLTPSHMGALAVIILAA